MPEGIDPTFYRSPAAAIAAPPEQLAYVAAFDPAGVQRDAMSVVDCDAGSATYGQVVGVQIPPPPLLPRSRMVSGFSALA